MGRSAGWEGVKGAILALLVLLSLLLSLGLWWSAAGPLTGEELWRQQGPAAPPAPEWWRVVRPTRLFVHVGERHLLFLPGTAGYQEAWETSVVQAEVLAGLGPRAGELVREADLRPSGEAVVVEARFPAPLPGAVVARAYGLRGDYPEPVEAFVLTPQRWPYVAVRCQGRLYPLEGAGGRDYRVVGELIARLAAPEASERSGSIPLAALTLPEGWEAAGGLWVPRLAAVRRLAAGFVPPPAYGQTLVGVFFADPSVVRRIEERDGATIFTDGRSGLRVYPSGALEYTTPRPAPARGSVDPAAALSAALSFLAGHGGVSRDMVVWECWPVRREGDETWVLAIALQAEGLLAVAPGGAVSLAVGEQGLYEYRAAAWTPWREAEGSHRIMSAQDALLRLAGETPGRTRVQDVYLAYLGHPTVGGELRPAWVIRTGQDVWAVDAVSGRVQSLLGRW